MINRTLISIACVTLILSSCNKISPKDITVIDGIKLGMDNDIFYSQLDSLNVRQQTFYTKVIFTDLNEVDANRINGYYTDIFNSSQYRSAFIQTYGLYYPTIMTGTKNIVGLSVLLIHTDEALLITKNSLGNITKESKISALSQNLSYNQIDEIANMLSNKYGKPSDTMHFDFTKFYTIEGDRVNVYHSDTSNVGDLLVWKTKYLDIKFFKGIASSTSTFNSKEHTYTTHLNGTPFREVNFESGERPCYSYSYISYELNSETIKKLELDKAKL